MMSAIILLISMVALLQFFVFYCRSVISATQTCSLSEQTREVTGIAGRQVSGDEFQRLVRLTELCPKTRQDNGHIVAIAVYHGLLNLVSTLSRYMAPALNHRTQLERSGCAYFAAVVLDRRIAFSRHLMAQEMSNSL